MKVKRIERKVEIEIIRKIERKIGERKRIEEKDLEMDNRDREEKIKMEWNEKVEKEEMKIEERMRKEKEIGILKKDRKIVEGGLRSNEVEEERIDNKEIVGIGSLENDEDWRIIEIRKKERSKIKFVIVGEIKVEMIMRREEEEGESEILNKKEIGEIERKLKIVVKRMIEIDECIEKIILRGLKWGKRSEMMMELINENG